MRFRGTGLGAAKKRLKELAGDFSIATRLALPGRSWLSSVVGLPDGKCHYSLEPLLVLTFRLRIHGVRSGKQNGDERKSTDHQGKPYGRKPRLGNQEQNVGISDRMRPSDGRPKGSIVDHVPEGKGPEESSHTHSSFHGCQ